MDFKFEYVARIIESKSPWHLPSPSPLFRLKNVLSLTCHSASRVLPLKHDLNYGIWKRKTIGMYYHFR